MSADRLEAIRAKLMRGQNGFTYYRDAEDQSGAAEDVEYLLTVAEKAESLLAALRADAASTDGTLLYALKMWALGNPYFSAGDPPADQAVYDHLVALSDALEPAE
jgi:hypothetical protein